MKRTLLLPTLILAASALPTQAQTPNRWDFGLGAHYSQEFYRQKITSFYNEPHTFSTKEEKSHVAWGVGLWAERRIGVAFSLLGQLDWHYASVKNWFMVSAVSKVGGVRDFKETYQSLAMAAKGRWYVLPKSSSGLFLEAGMKADQMVRFRFQDKRIADVKEWAPQNFNAVVPGVLAGLGWKAGRVTLTAEYQHFIWNDAFTGKLAVAESYSFFRRELFRQNVSVTAACSLSRPSRNEHR